MALINERGTTTQHQRVLIRRAMIACIIRAMDNTKARLNRVDTCGLMNWETRTRLQNWCNTWESYLRTSRGQIASRVPSTELRSVSCLMRRSDAPKSDDQKTSTTAFRTSGTRHSCTS